MKRPGRSKPQEELKRRKPDAERKDEMIRLRVTAEQLAEFEQVAKAEGLELSTWLRSLATKAVKAAKIAE